ncbi:thioredoxin domain-containing protein 11 [Choristoneura fumiferana]|uniref:thioredoxin domain-containing protein 11 n=1 Tax=Choristoneura fumiferana TaxID=7141 RepID=UPI003D15A72A
MFPTVDTEENIVQVALSSNTSSPSKHAQKPSENSDVAKQHNNKESVTMLVKEMVFFVALALTTYGALHNTPSKISKHPKAIKFFNSDSLVTDWHKGQLSNAHATINNVDVSFVMYYAPWDAESQYVRGQFEEAAMILNDRVQFSAINCWNPGSECRLQHNKIPSWPILIAYTSTSRGVLYKGPRNSHNMVKFLELILKPLQRVSGTDDLVQLLSVCDAVAVGYTPLTDSSKHYNTWYHVALKIREFDFVGEVCFGVVTSEDLALDLGVNSVPSARLMLWNDTKEYVVSESEMSIWNESSLMSWVLENFSQPVARIEPMWRKAFTFERYVDGNPLLILFTPLNPLYEQLPSYSLLREVAMEYYNCNNNESLQWTTELIKLQLVQRLLYQQKNFMKFCEDYKFKQTIRKTNQYYKKEIVSHNNKYPWINSTEKTQRSGVFNYLFKRGFDISKIIGSGDDKSYLLSSLGLMEECSPTVMPAEKSFYENYEQCQSFEEKARLESELLLEEEDLGTTMLPFEDDPLSPENLIQDNVKHFCKLMKFAKTWGPPITPQKVSSGNITHIQGLACAHNFSLNMLAVDSVRNHHFAESLGIDIDGKKDKTAVVILDSKHESQYLLSEEYTAKSLRDFIYNFTHKSLKRSLRTVVDEAVRTHYFGSDGQSEQMGIDEHTVHVLDLTTKTFRRLVKKPEELTLVAVCGGMCGAATTRALLEASRLLAGCGEPARAARLDALRHDLPWHYTVHTYPTIFVLAKQRGEAESARFPGAARVSAGGLVALALRALPPPRRVRVRLALCAQQQSTKEKKTCLKDIREHITTVIGRNLKYWRQTENRELKDALFKRLQYLHRVSLELSLLHITDLNDHFVNKQSLHNSLNSLSENWDIDLAILRQNVLTSSASAS